MKTAIITGGSSGIGLAIGEKFLELGLNVYSLDLNPPPTKSIHYISCDLSNAEAIESAFSEIQLNNPTIDVLVNNCGMQYMAPIEEFPLAKWKLMIDVMLTGTFLTTQAVIPSMKKQKSGRIINISSVHGKQASAFKAAYVSAKHGVLGFTKVAAKELGSHGVTVNAICPGYVDTPLMRKQVKDQMELNNLSEEKVLEDIFLKDQDIKQLTTPENVADLCAFLISESASSITAEAYNMSGGWGA